MCIFDYSYFLFSEYMFVILAIVVVVIIISLIVNAYFSAFEKLKRNEKLLYNTMQELPLPTVIINKELKILFVNRAFVAFYGFEAKDIPYVRNYFDRMFTDKIERLSLWNEWSVIMKEAFYTQKLPPILEYPYYDTYGDKKWIEAHYSISGNKAVIMHVDTSGKKDRQQEVIKAIVHAEEEERSRMAKELHDGLGPLVSTAKIYAHTLNKDTKDDEMRMHGERLVQILDETLVEIRNISNNISPHILRNYGLRDGIESFVEKIRPISTVSFKLLFNHTKQISHTQQFTVYRAIVEMINNTMKYAEAKNVSITFNDIEVGVEIVYTDDGKGFNLDEEKDKGFGLSNIRSRIENLDGHFQYNTMPDKGVKINIKLNC